MGVSLNEILPILARIHPQHVGWAFSQYPANRASQYLLCYAEAQCAWLAQVSPGHEEAMAHFQQEPPGNRSFLLTE